MRRLAWLVTCIALTAGVAHAADGSVRPANYVFPDGMRGFALASHGGVINPGVLVGFNPQPDPPGDFGGTMLDLSDPSDPMLTNPTPGGYRLLFSLVGFGDGSVRTLGAPNADGFTGFHQAFGDHSVNVSFRFGPGPVDPASWVAFNPQPDPPGDFVAQDLSFAGDPFVAFHVSVDGQALSFTVAGVPEPTGWAAMILGFGLAGATLRLSRRRPHGGEAAQVPV